MAMRIDLPGSPGTAGQARLDGASGLLVSLVDTTPGGAAAFELKYVPDADTMAIATLAVDPTDGHAWTFTANAEGPYRITHTHTSPDGSTFTETRIYGIADTNGIVPAAPGERSNPNVTIVTAEQPDNIAACERNVPTARWPRGQPFGWAGALAAVSGGGGLAAALNPLAPGDTGATLLIGAVNYYTAGAIDAVPPTFLLPDAQLNAGKVLELYIVPTRGGSRVYLQPSADDEVFGGGAAAGGSNIGGPPKAAYHGDQDDALTTTGARYRFTAFTHPAAPGQGLWSAVLVEDITPTRAMDVVCATAERLPAYTPAGLGFVDATFTANAAGALNVDGINLQAGDVFLDLYGVGPMVVIDMGDGGSPWKIRAHASATKIISTATGPTGGLLTTARWFVRAGDNFAGCTFGAVPFAATEQANIVPIDAPLRRGQSVSGSQSPSRLTWGACFEYDGTGVAQNFQTGGNEYQPVGARFAVRRGVYSPGTSLVAGSLQLGDGAGSVQFEDDFGALLNSILLSDVPGAYREWVSNGDGTWQLRGRVDPPCVHPLAVAALASIESYVCSDVACDVAANVTIGWDAGTYGTPKPGSRLIYLNVTGAGPYTCNFGAGFKFEGGANPLAGGLLNGQRYVVQLIVDHAGTTIVKLLVNAAS